MADNQHTEEKSRSQKQEDLLKSFNHLTNLPFNQILWFGQFLFRHRAIIVVPFFILLVIFSEPKIFSVLAIIFVLTGIGIRLWASGYIGANSRQRNFSAQYVITNGPYKLLKHPLYLGNFLLVLGTILLFSPPIILGNLLIVIFILEYSIIIVSEMNYLKDLPKKEVRFALANCKSEISTIMVMLFIFLIYFAKWKLFKN